MRLTADATPSIYPAGPPDQGAGVSLHASESGVPPAGDSDAALPEPTPRADGVELLAAIRRGDRRAFRALYEQFGAEVLALCERIVQHRADAEDVTADVFWEVWRRRDRFDANRGGARAYLMTLARSRAIDRLRSQAARPESRPGDRPPPDQVELVATAASPEQSAAEAELKRRVAAAVSRLENRQREAMELAYYEGLSHQQIADRLGTPLGSVKTHIRKALEKLRYALRELNAEG